MNKSVANINVSLKKISIKTSHQVPDCGPQFSTVLAENDLSLRRAEPTEIQINLGKLCNLACHHCHVDAGPNRTENMTWEIMEKILNWIDSTNIKKADLTGGAPELNPHFRRFCSELIARGIQITSRCNITVLYEPGQEDLAQWYADNNIRLVCSLPCYTEDNVDAQRGKGVFDKSISGLKLLNKLGYGIEGSSLLLDLVYNPVGAFLPPEQSGLEKDYRDMLSQNFNITFSNLLAITNIPINRFAHSLRRDGKLENYQELLVNNFNSATVDNLMCRHLYNVDWLGKVYDCDFNQMLDIPMANKKSQYIWEVDNSKTKDAHIAVDRHCFGCTAGAGSSCSGTLA
jgi:radical SAM/Cys-rich protein